MIELWYGQWILPYNTTEALSFFYTNENLGPPNINDTNCYLNCLKKSFPNAEIIATSLDEYVENVLLKPEVYHNIPVLNGSSNIGDGWVYGIQSDPLKIAVSREAERIIYQNLENNINNNNNNNKNTGGISVDDEEFKWYLRKLHKATEHNGGLEFTSCSNTTLYASDIYTAMSNTSNNVNKYYNEWILQRNFSFPPLNTEEISKLHNTFTISPAWQSIFENITNISNNLLKPNNFNITHNPDTNKKLTSKTQYDQLKGNVNENIVTRKCGNWKFSLDLYNGAFSYLENLETCYNYATNNSQFGKYIYQTFESSLGLPQGVGVRCTKKYGDSCNVIFNYSIQAYNIYEQNITVSKSGSATAESQLQCVIELQYINDGYNKKNNNRGWEYGAPNKTIVEMILNPFDIEYKFYWFDKAPSCIVQSHYVSFDLIFGNNGIALVDNLGIKINPALSFNRTISRYHGIGQSVTILDRNNRDNYVEFDVLDSALVTFGDISELVTGSINVTYTQPESYSQFKVILYNNWWNQTFPSWYNLNAMSRINVKFNPDIASICA